MYRKKTPITFLLEFMPVCNSQYKNRVCPEI